MTIENLELLNQLITLVFNKTLNDNIEDEEKLVVELIDKLTFTKNDVFELFKASYNHLLERVNGCINSSKQMKLCFHERDENKHICPIKTLILFWKIYFKRHPGLEAKINLNSLFDFILTLNCVSQIPTLFDLFSSNEQLESIVKLTRHLIEMKQYIHATIIIVKFNIQCHFDSNHILTELLFEDNKLDVEFYLRLISIRFDQTTLPALISIQSISQIDELEDEKRCHFILINFMKHLDLLFQNGLSNVEQYPLLQRITGLQRKHFIRKVNRFILDLFKTAAFDVVEDDLLYQICPNITKNFYGKQLSGLLFKLRDDSFCTSVNVIKEQIEPLERLLVGSEFFPQTHEQILNFWIKRNDFNSAANYAQIYNLNTNLTTYNQLNQNSNSHLINEPKLHFNQKILLVETEKQFNECLNDIKNCKLISIDSEWFTNQFQLRTNIVTVSLIQIATEKTCYLIDCELLKPLHSYLERLIQDIVNCPDIRKLGYNIAHDYHMIWISYEHHFKQVANLNLKPIEPLQPKNSIDLRDLFAQLSSTNGELFNYSRLQIGSNFSGLANLTYSLLEVGIDKTEQLSNWSRRPLRQSQITYAAIDAICLLQCYHELKRLFVGQRSLNDFIEKEFDQSTTARNEKSRKQIGTNYIADSEIREPMDISKFRCIVDDMLFGIIRYLRICNADTLMADSSNRERSVRLALKENRVFITSGQVYDRYRKHFDRPTDCIQLCNSMNALDQFKQLVEKCNLIIRLEDLFVRCSLCNTTPFIIVSGKQFKTYYEQYLLFESDPNSSIQSKMFEAQDIENGTRFPINFQQFGRMKFIHKMPSSERFYICSQCGHIYWDGCHSPNFINSIKSLLVQS